jgi:formylglycine-generating enzyme required for sulfatase activity
MQGGAPGTTLALIFTQRQMTELDQINEEILRPDTTHARRSLLGLRLAELGDTRPGVGVTPDGLPDIAWLSVGEGSAQVGGQRFQVRAFYIAQYPITYRQFQAFVDDPAGYANAEWWDGLSLQHDEPSEAFHPFDNYPRDNVSWYDAVAFCRWLTTRLRPAPSEMGERIRTQGWQVRLPTEWEWLQAATGGDPAYRYPWGADWQERFTQPMTDGVSTATAVGLYPQGGSPVGAMDMCSSLWEWCQNEYDSPAHTGCDGKLRRALRGGRWALDVEEGTSILERDFQLGPYVRANDTSFRIGCCPPG